MFLAQRLMAALSEPLVIRPAMRYGFQARKLLPILLGFLLPIFLLEFAARGYAKLKFKERVLAYDSTLGWKLVPLAKRVYEDEAEPYLIEINSEGLRDKEHSYDKSPNIFRIVVVGDSFVFGSGGVSPMDRFTDRMENFSSNLEVINMGVPGYSTDQEYLYLKTEGLKYHPDLVVMCMFVNDYDESFVTLNPSLGRPKGYFSAEGGELIFHPPAVSPFYILSQRSYLIALTEAGLRKNWKGYGRRRLPRKLKYNEEVRTFKLLLVSTRDLCKSSGADVVFVYFPFQGQQNRSLLRDVSSELAQTKGFKVLDLTDFMARVNAERPAYFATDIHFNKYGHQVVANVLYDFLVRNTALKEHVRAIAARVSLGQRSKESIGGH